MTDRRLRDRLRDILDAVASIERYESKRSSVERELIESHVARQLEIIGEAVYRLPQSFKKAYPHVPWREVAALRHIIVHDYWELDYERLWSIVRDHLPAFKTEIRELLDSLPPADP